MSLRLQIVGRSGNCVGLPTRAQVFVWSMYSRRTVKEAYRLQEAISTAFSEENFGDYNEKTFLDIATPAELFDWMQGPLQDGLFPDTVCCRDWWWPSGYC